MSDYSEFTFTLDNRLAAVSAINDGSAVLATDGISCCVRRICGCRQSDAVGTLRPYRRLRRASDGVGYTAISCEGSRIYRLNDAFCECGYTELESGCGCGCRCGCGCSDECDYCLTDAMTISIGAIKTEPHPNIPRRNGVIVFPAKPELPGNMRKKTTANASTPHT